MVVGAIATGEPIAVGAAVLIAIGLIAATASSLVNTLRCYERGLVKRTLFGRERKFAYSEANVLVYQVTRVVSVYAQTNVRLEVVPAKPHRKIRLFGPYPEGIEAFRDAVAAAIAKKMIDRLASETEIAWSGKVRLSREGVLFPKAKFIGSETVSIPFSDNPKASFERGRFHLAGKESALVLETGAPNFYSGYLAMELLRARCSSALSWLGHARRADLA